jgi:cyclohexadieny/prephenate dehydrogenase
LPHLIAYTIVGTAFDLEESIMPEVFKFAAGGFRDFTRIAASDPVMWRDIFLKNSNAVLDVLASFIGNLNTLKHAIRQGDSKTLEDIFTRTRGIRKGIIEARQD